MIWSNNKFLKLFTKKILPIFFVFIILSVAILTPVGAKPVFAQANAGNTSNDPALSSLPECGFTQLTNCLAWGAFLILWIVSMSTTISGIVLEKSVLFSIQSFGEQVAGSSVVMTGWVVFRDLANVVFIFLILWVAIATILGLHHGNTMGSVLKIVIAAILINFSLLLTKIIIDGANILALHFYGLITANGEGQLSGMLMHGLKIQTIYDPSGMVSDSPAISKIITISIFGAIMLLISSWVFLAAAFMFLARSVYLIVLMVLSPFAFIAWVVPGLESMTHNWWHKLFKQAFFAPIFMTMIYVLGKIIQTPPQGDTSGTIVSALNAMTNADPNVAAADKLTAALGASGIFLNFFLIIGFLVAALLAGSYFGQVGASTAISWGNKIRGMGQSWVGGRLIGMPARAIEERFQKTYFGNTAMGKRIREWTVIPLKNAKWGGDMSAEERHEEDLEMISKRKEAEEVQGVLGLRRGGPLGVTVGKDEHNAESLVLKIETEKAEGEARIAEKDAIVNGLREKLAKDPTNVALQNSLKQAEEERKATKQEVYDGLEKERGELQKVLVRLTPHAFAEMMPKSMLFNEEIMRNASRGQMMAILGSDHFAEHEKDKVRAARYGHIKRATDELKEKEKEYDEEYQEYTQFFTEIGTLEEGNEDEKIKKQLDRMGLRYGSPERAAKEAEIKWAMSSYRGATTDEEKKTANEEGLKLLEKPSRKMIGDVAPDVRVWIRAMADQELDEMYKFDPKMVADRNLTTTIRSSAVIYGRKSENIASIDKDGFRDAKLSTIIDAEDLVNGIGELAPSFETFRHMLDNMTANGAKEVEALKRMTAAEYTKFQGGNNRDAWEKLKEDYLRKAVKKIAFEKGTYQDYVSGFNAEQRGLAQLGDEKMIESIGGQSADEFPILRGLRWRNPAFAKYMTRQIAKEFRQKDTGDIKEVMDMVLFDFKKMLDTGGTFKISDANMDLLHWVATESQGKEFKNRDLVNPELQEYFDKMLAIFGEMGRNTNPTYEAFDTAKKKLKY
jgi:hypothetical protein